MLQYTYIHLIIIGVMVIIFINLHFSLLDQVFPASKFTFLQSPKWNAPGSINSQNKTFRAKFYWANLSYW